jgi:hypothetical protein
MALKLNLGTTQFVAAAPEAYARVTNFFGNKDNIQVQVSVHYNEDARHGNMSPVMEHAHYIGLADLAGKGELMPAIYEVLKTMAPYQGASDV